MKQPIIDNDGRIVDWEAWDRESREYDRQLGSLAWKDYKCHCMDCGHEWVDGGTGRPDGPFRCPLCGHYRTSMARLTPVTKIFKSARPREYTMSQSIALGFTLEDWFGGAPKETTNDTP